MNCFLCKIKNWMLLIHSATLEIRSVLNGVKRMMMMMMMNEDEVLKIFLHVYRCFLFSWISEMFFLQMNLTITSP